MQLQYNTLILLCFFSLRPFTFSFCLYLPRYLFLRHPTATKPNQTNPTIYQFHHDKHHAVYVANSNKVGRHVVVVVVVVVPPGYLGHQPCDVSCAPHHDAPENRTAIYFTAIVGTCASQKRKESAVDSGHLSRLPAPEVSLAWTAVCTASACQEVVTFSLGVPASYHVISCHVMSCDAAFDLTLRSIGVSCPVDWSGLRWAGLGWAGLGWAVALHCIRPWPERRLPLCWSFRRMPSRPAFATLAEVRKNQELVVVL